MKQKREREEACAVCGHYHDYEGGEPCGICGHRLMLGDPRAHAPSALPTEVLPGFLFLGSYDHASRMELLKTLGIEHILNTVPTCPNLYKNSFDYHTVSASPPPLDECFAFIERVRAAGGKLLVHCMSGGSRSPAVVVYYLMRAQGMRLDAAYALVSAKRPAVCFGEADAARLSEAEAALFGAGASGFRVPLGKQQPQAAQPMAFQQPAFQQQQQPFQQNSAPPFGWPAAGNSGGIAPPPQPPQQLQPGSFVMGQPGAATGPFVFGAH